MLQEKIIEFMLSRKYKPMKEDELVSYFPNYSEEEIKETIKDMKENYLIMTNKNENMILASKRGFFTGEVTGVIEDSIFVKLPQYEKDFRIRVNPGTIVLPKDIVLIHLAEDETFEKVIKRTKRPLVGEIVTKEVREGKYEYYIVPQSKKLNLTLKLRPEQCKNLVNGHKVVFELEGSKVGVNPVIKEIIGYKDDPGVDIQAYLIEAEAPIDFSEECINEANSVSREVTEEDLKTRTDFRENMIFTIDGADAKDFDDAVEVYEKEDGGFRIGVHIADVSAFVSEGGAIDKDAVDRGTSIYLIYSVIPMLPQILSNGSCSLVPHQDRLTMSFIMDIDSEGNLIEGETKLGVINSKKRFTYDEVNKIVEDNDPETIAKNKEFVPMLNAMIKASAAIRANRDRRGQLNLDIPEAKILTDENGHPIGIEPRSRGLGEMAIEDLMILTNEYVASTYDHMNLPFMYRVHEAPSPEKIEHFMHIARGMGHKVKNKKNGFYSSDVVKVLDEENDELVKTVLSSLLLRSLPKAYYGPTNIGHFGLASKAYMQVTSPIRRYPDLVAHRLIKKYMFEPEKFAELNFDYIEEYLSDIGKSTSMQEKRAEQLERDVTKMKMAEYMEDKIGETFKGKISGFTEKGLFVQLPNTVEGYIKYDYLKDDIYIYDKHKMIAEGKKTHNVLRIGSPFEVKVYKASKRDSMIDFVPSNYKITKSVEEKKTSYRKKGKRHG